MTPAGRSTKALIDELTLSMNCLDAESAIRAKAATLLDRYVQAFGEPEMPVSVEVLASLCGITRSDDAPVHSEDAELGPDGQGGMTMRVNADRPETRQRFSIAHEISHTFFPNYANKEWCRTDARYRSRENPDDYLEMLCDIGAAELLFPQPWFGRNAASVSGAAGIVELAAAFHGSREATLRRYAETSQETLAVSYFTWRLKPTRQSTVGNRDQRRLFDESTDDMIREALRLRIEYSVPSPAFRAAGHFLPNDKSVESDGPIYQASLTCESTDGECDLDLGTASVTYRIWAVPLWTPREERGGTGEWKVAAVLRPLAVRKSVKKRRTGGGSSLFDLS
jgi:Zn-dependent peptidase ImmA (M78 family)